ncbi:MFSAntibioticEffluxPump (modular protein) [Frankia canadensis]|uniref:MFSAntibioticEffluxPump (Modular protein) n=1 Tax=Frankia canadensis TaxID=1836972 RepID=A0A2I2KNK7_9ACTN|nr:MFS transporter [Frankia canadensis]SNQ47254.1 MFSAntibioticEffluxPump (modular protein) [Frankia canadensis]SOU54544.1 MFSAntibioticEffluxPump (modular protein) [Frankia canadensis]
MNPTISTAPRAGRREWIGLAVLALPTLLIALNNSVLHLALPHLSADLRPSSAQLLWIMDIYGFLIAGSLITLGARGDRIGRRRLLIIGAAAFGAASVLASFSTSPTSLILARAALGLAGGALMPSTLSLISTMFQDPRQRTVAIGAWMTCFSVGSTLGPLFGGLLLEHFWWGSVFLLSVPVMLLLLITGPILLPEARDPDPGPLDLISAAMTLATILLIVYGLKRLAENGVDGEAILITAAGLALAVAFAVRQRRLAVPFLDHGLFTKPAFSASLGTMTLSILAMAGTQLFITQYLQLVEGLTPFVAGLWMIPGAAGLILGTNLGPALARRVRPATIVGTGLLVAAAGYGLLTQLPTSSGLAVLMIATFAIGVGLGPMMTLSTDLIVNSAPPEKAGSASATSETGGELGMALGIAVIGSVGNAVYRSDMSGAVPPGTRPKPPRAHGTPSAAPWTSPTGCPARSARTCSRLPATPSPMPCTSTRRSAAASWPPSRSSPWWYNDTSAPTSQSTPSLRRWPTGPARRSDHSPARRTRRRETAQCSSGAATSSSEL